MVESFQHKYSSFLTLTYRDEDLPLNEFGLPTLNPRDLTLFWKSLRNDGVSIKYYSIGEYGGKFGRPHYHAICFFDEPLYFNLYWSHGTIRDAPVSPADIHYVSKFHMYPKASGLRSDFTVRPFARMSKGLGLNYLKSYFKFDSTSELPLHTGEILDDFELPDFIKYNGYSYPMPRYFKKLMLSPPKEFHHMVDKLSEEYGPIKASIMIAQMLEVSERKLQKYNINSNLR